MGVSRMSGSGQGGQAALLRSSRLPRLHEETRGDAVVRGRRRAYRLCELC